MGTEERLGMAATGELAVEDVGGERDEPEPWARWDGGQIGTQQSDGVSGAEGAAVFEQTQVGNRQHPTGERPRSPPGGEQRAVQRRGFREGRGTQSCLLGGAPGGADEELDPGPWPPPVVAQPPE